MVMEFAASSYTPTRWIQALRVGALDGYAMSTVAEVLSDRGMAKTHLLLPEPSCR
jgi:hypothetical protein